MSTTQEVFKIIEDGAANAMTIEQIIKQEIDDWYNSQDRKDMLAGEKYYRNKSDILDRKRMTIGDGGAQIEAKNLANNKIVHGFLRKLVDQKAGYLLSKEMSIQTENKVYDEMLSGFFDKGFKRMLKSLLKESIKKGRAWLHIYYDEKGNFRFKMLPSEEIIPHGGTLLTLIYKRSSGCMRSKPIKELKRPLSRKLSIGILRVLTVMWLAPAAICPRHL